MHSTICLAPEILASLWMRCKSHLSFSHTQLSQDDAYTVSTRLENVFHQARKIYEWMLHKFAGSCGACMGKRGVSDNAWIGSQSFFHHADLKVGLSKRLHESSYAETNVRIRAAMYQRVYAFGRGLTSTRRDRCQSYC